MSNNDNIYVGFANGKKGCSWTEENSNIQSFDELELVPGLLKNLHELFRTGKNKNAIPLPIQKYALKPAMDNQDINCLSATGTKEIFQKLENVKGNFIGLRMNLKNLKKSPSTCAF